MATENAIMPLESPSFSEPVFKSKRRRAPLSCEECRRRKVRCDRQKPCRPCQTARKHLVCRYGTELEESKGANAISDPSSQPIWRDLDSQGTTISKSPPATSASGSSVVKGDEGLPFLHAGSGPGQQRQTPLLYNSAEHVVKVFGPAHWIHMTDMFEWSKIGFRDRQLGVDPCNDDLSQATTSCWALHECIKGRWDVCSAYIVQNSSNRFPSQATCTRAVNAYLRTFEAIYRILHVPTFWNEYNQFWKQTPASLPIFSIKLGLVLTIGLAFSSAAAELDFWRQHAPRWMYAAQLWLLESFPPSSSSLEAMQVGCLLLVAREVRPMKTSTWISTESLLGVALRIGLHHDPQRFPDLSPFEREMRARLWTTALELTVRASLNGGTPLLLPLEDFGTHLPTNVRDDDLFPEITAGELAARSQVQTRLSIQLLLRESLPLRIQVAQAINNQSTIQPYSTVLQLASEVRTACSHIACFFEEEEAVDSTDSDMVFHRKFIDVQLRQGLLLLLKPFVLRTQPDPQHYLARQTCLESSMAIAAYSQNMNLALEHLGDDFSHLMVAGRGLLRGAFHASVISALAGEVIIQLHEELSYSSRGGGNPLNHLARAQRTPIVGTLQHLREQLKETMRMGYPGLKRYLFISSLLAQINALETGHNVRGAVLSTVQESLHQAHTILQAVCDRQQ